MSLDDTLDTDISKAIKNNNVNLIRSIITSKNLEKIKTIITNTNDANFKFNSKFSILMMAIMCSSLDVIKLLVERGADVNFKNSLDFNPLMIAIYYKHLDIADYLLEVGANINQVNCYGNDSVCEIVKVNCLNLLTTHFTKINNINYKNIKNGDTYLILSAKNENISISKFLLENNILANIRNNQGDSALNIATVKRNYKLIELLQKYKVRQYRGSNGLTPREYATRTSDAQAIKLLYSIF